MLATVLVTLKLRVQGRFVGSCVMWLARITWLLHGLCGLFGGNNCNQPFPNTGHVPSTVPGLVIGSMSPIPLRSWCDSSFHREEKHQPPDSFQSLEAWCYDGITTISAARAVAHGGS